MQKTHSQKHTCIFPIPTWLIRFFSSRNFPGSSNTQTQKNNGDCYDTTRGCCSRELATEKVGIKGYLAFFLTIIFFSGVFSGTDSWWRVFDFSVLNGSFGQLPGANGATTSFRGAGGAGAKDGFSLRWSWHRQSFSRDYFNYRWSWRITRRAAVNDASAKTVVGHSRDLARWR